MPLATKGHSSQAEIGRHTFMLLVPCLKTFTTKQAQLNRGQVQPMSENHTCGVTLLPQVVLRYHYLPKATQNTYFQHSIESVSGSAGPDILIAAPPRHVDDAYKHLSPN